MLGKPPLIPVELVPPERGVPGPPVVPGHATDASAPVTPFHPGAVTMMLVFDYLWTIPEFAIVDWPLTIPACFLCVAVSTFLIQRRKHGDRRRVAMAKALLLGTIAAVPFPVASSVAGLGFLAWIGIKKANR